MTSKEEESNDSDDKKATMLDEVTVAINKSDLAKLVSEAEQVYNVPKSALKKVFIKPNTYRSVSDDYTKRGFFFIPYGWYIVNESIPGEKYKFQRVARHDGSNIVEFGPSEGKITAAHLRSIPLFEAILDKLSEDRKKAGALAISAVGTCTAPVLHLRNNAWGCIFACLAPSNTKGVFSFEFDAGLLGLMLSCRTLHSNISMHPVWITKVLGLRSTYIGSVLACPGLTCAGVANHICLNAARLPDVIRTDPKFYNILRPETRHDISEKQALVEVQSPEVEPKLRAVQLLGTFLLGEPAYRGDAEKDPITAELQALCQKVAKEDPIFILKLAHYVRHTLTFRNTTNFLLASAAKIETCRPFVRPALPKCTNLPTDLLELWDFWRKLSGSIALPACLKKAFADKLEEFGEFQLGKYLNAMVPKPIPSPPSTSGGGKGKGKGKGKSKGETFDEKDPKDAQKAAEELVAKKNDPLTRPLTLKTLIRVTHVGKKNPELVCGVLRKCYPMDEEEFKMMGLDMNGSKEFDPERMGEKLRVPVPKTWETQLSEKGNTAEVWEELIKSKSLPFMAMLRNLRNVLMAGVDDKAHGILLSRLKSQHQVAGSKQVPVRFLSAFDAIDYDDAALARLAEEAKSDRDFIEEEKAVGTGKEAKKIMKKRAVCRRPPTRELLDKYRDALEIAVSLAAKNNVPELQCPSGGKVVILVDVSGSMNSPLTQGPKKLHESAMQPHRRSSGRPIVEGQDMDLEDYFSQSGQRHSRKVSVSQTWIGQDLDLSVMALDKDGREVVSVSYSNTSWESIWHSGDITNAPYGAEEVISVDLDKLPENAFMLFFTVNSYSGQTFDEMPEAAVSLRDDGLEGDSIEGTQEICAFRLTGKHKAVVACCLIRKSTGWSFRCLNTPQAQGATVHTLLGKIRKDYDAAMADAATAQKRLVDAALLLSLCVRERLGDDKCEIVLFSSPGKNGGPGYHVMRGLGPKVLSNVRRCHAEAANLGRGTKLPIEYLQELHATRISLDHLILLTDGLIEPAKNPGDALSRWLSSYRACVQKVKFSCIDVLGLGKPCVAAGSNDQDVMISGWSEATLRYLAQEPGAQLAEIEAIELPPPKKQKSSEEPTETNFSPPPRS